MALRGQIEVKHISSIFRRVVTWKRLQIGPYLPLKLNRKSWMLFQMAALALTWSDLERSKSRSRIFCNLEPLADRAMVTINVE